MFCRFGSVEDSLPGSGHRLVEGGVDPAVLARHRDQRVHDRHQLGHVAVTQQVLQDRMLGLREQAGERLGVGGVAGLDPLGLGQAELVEQQFLQLLGRAQVELVPGDRVRGLLGRLGLAVQHGRHGREVLGVGGDPGALHLGQHVDQRQLELPQQRHRLAPVQVLFQRRGQLERGLGPQHQGGRRVALARAVQRQLAVFGLLAQLLAQVAQRQVGQVEGALAGQRQVGGQRRVAGQPGQRQAAGHERVHRALGVVQDLRVPRVGQPGRQGAARRPR